MTTNDDLTVLLYRAAQAGRAKSMERATMGALNADGEWEFDVPGRPSLVWVTLIQNTGEVSFDTVELRGGLRIGGYPVIIETDPLGVRFISGPDGVAAEQFLGFQRSTTAAYVAQHADSHTIGGGDTVLVDARQIRPGLISVSSGLTVTNVDAAPYIYNGAQKVMPAGETLDLTSTVSAIASGKRAWALVGIDPVNNTLVVAKGGDAPDAVALDTADIASITFTGYIPLTAVRLQASQTTIRESDLFDMRHLAGALWGVGGAVGDMFKTTYDTDDDGLVEKVAFEVLDSDPASPEQGQAWVLKSADAANSGSPIGLLLALTKTAFQYELSVYADGATRRVTLS